MLQLKVEINAEKKFVKKEKSKANRKLESIETWWLHCKIQKNYLKYLAVLTTTKLRITIHRSHRYIR